MHDSIRTYQELLEEISILKQRNQELEKAEAERKRAEEAMSDTETRYRMLFEHSPDGIVIIDPATARPLEFNETAHRQLGYSREGFQRLSISDIDVSETSDETRSHIRKVVTEGRSDFETIHRTREGEIRNIHVTAQNTVLSGRSVYHCIWRDITERKQAEETLRESEEKHRLLIENSHDIICTLTTDGVFTYVSPSWTALLGYPVTRVVGQPYQQFVHPDDLAVCVVFMQSVIETGQRQEGVEYRVRHKDGSWYWHTSSAVPLKNQDGTILGFEGIARDITAQKQLEEKLKSSEENFRTFFNTVDDMIIVGSPDGRIIYNNPTMTLKLGYSPDEFKNMHVLDVHPTEMRQEAEAIFTAMFKGELDVCPLPLKSKTGALIPAETRVWFGKWSGAECIFGISKDLTKEQEALQKFNRLFNSNPSPMAVSSLPEARVTDVNEAFIDTLGYSRGEILGKTSEELGLFLHPENQRAVAQQLQTQGRIVNCELEVKCKDGRILDGLFSGEIIESQGVTYLLTVMVDQTKRKQAEETLRDSEANYRLLIENIHDIIVSINPEGVLTFVSSSWTTLLGYPVTQVIGKSIGEFIHPGDLAKWQEFLDKVIKTGQRQSGIEYRVRHADGSWRWIKSNGAPVKNSVGTVVGYQGVASDITLRKQANDYLEKMVKDRTTELSLKNKLLAQEIRERSHVDVALRKKAKEVQRKADRLVELNSALKVILKQREDDKAELEEKVLSNIQHLITPNLENLKKQKMGQENKIILEILESNLNDITTPFGSKLSSKYLKLTPTEIKVANLVKEGKSIKEIAEIMIVSHHTIDLHRFNLRKKLGLKSRKINLQSHLLSLS